MLKKLIYSNSIFSLVILILMIIVLWAKVFTNTVSMMPSVPASPLYHFVYKYLTDLNIICSIISIALITLEALLINYMLSENDMIPRNSYVAAFLFIVVSSFFNDLIILNPVLIANIFLITAIWLFMRLYEEHEAYSTVFNIGTLLSIASMFYFPSIIFLILIFIGFIIYRSFSLRYWFISILGLILPYIFLASYYFWNDCLLSKVNEYKHSFNFINFHKFSPTLYANIIFGFTSLLLFLGVIKLLIIINEKAIRLRKFLSFLIWFVIISIVSFYFSAEYGILGFVMMLTSVSVIFTLFLNNLKKSFWSESILIALLLLLISGRFGFWNFG